MPADGATRYHEIVMLARVLLRFAGIRRPGFDSCLAAALLGLFSVGVLFSQAAADPAAIARKALDLLLAQNYPEFAALASPQLKTNLNEQSFGKLGAEIKGWGAVEKIGEPVVEAMGPTKVVTIPVSFAEKNIKARFAINVSGQVSVMYLMPGEAEWTRPAYSKPDSFTERAVTFGDDEWKLPGTLAVPKGAGPFPAVLLVQDFGPKDRDDSHAVITKPFRDLSDGLASRGVVVLRYEKRIRQYAGRMSGKPYTADDETVDDAVAALAFLRGQSAVDPKQVYLVGHGLGGYLAPRIAAEDTKLAGMVVMAANQRPLEDLMLDELMTLGITGKNLEQAKAAVARVKSLEQNDADAPAILGLAAAYWLDLKGYDPAAEAKKLTIPILILYGERDFQVPKVDFDLWKSGLAGRKNVTARSYPALNHAFVAGSGPSTEKEYEKPGHVAPEVVDDIAKFVGK
ncbi:MAG: alpha/beta fold hydrolase [Bryobacteraceae bacterium]|jgi:dienelactone hydrolase